MTLSEVTNLLDQIPNPVFEGGRFRNATWMERCKSRFSPAYRSRQHKNIFPQIISALRRAPRVSPREAFKSKEVFIIRMWIFLNLQRPYDDEERQLLGS